jgi:hypothetical protein
MSILCSMVGASFTVAAAAEVLRSKKGIQAVGNAQIDTAQSKFGGSAALFDGTGDYLQIENIASGITEDQTFEFWIRFSDLPTSGGFRMIAGDGGGTRYLGLLNDGGTYRWEVSFSDGQYVERFTTSVSTGVWYHVALTKSGSTLKMYQAGTALTSAVSFNTMTAAKTLFVAGTNYIGSWNNSSNFFNGWLDEIRVSNNVRYTANFTAPTAPFVNDANTVLLIHANGTDGSTFFEDDNGVRAPKGISANGNAQISTAQSKFGGSSLYLDGSGDYLELPGAVNTPELNTPSWTVEFWCYISAAAGDYTHNIGLWNDNNGYCAWYISTNMYQASRKLGIQYIDTNGNNSGPVQFGSTLSTGTWFHAAFVNNNGTLTAYKDGTSIGTHTMSGTIRSSDGTSNFRIGKTYNAGDFNGYLDEIRISNSVRYTANFTAPTAPFQNDANTVLLIHANQSNGSTIFQDDNSGTVTTEDSYTVPTAAFTSDALTVALYHLDNALTDSGPNAFTLNTSGGYSSSTVKFGSYSGNLSDSTSDYFAHTTDRQFTPYNGSILTDLTWECWVYYTSFSGASFNHASQNNPHPTLLVAGDQSGNRQSMKFGFSGSEGPYASGLLCFAAGDSGNGNIDIYTERGTTSFSLNTWYHVALTYNSLTGNVKGYVDGVKQFTKNAPNVGYTLPTHFTIGAMQSNNSACFVDEVRISRMIRYGI